MKYNFDEVVNRRGMNAVKWEQNGYLAGMGMTKEIDDETISLYIADMDLKSPQPIVDAMHRVADYHMYGYSMPFDDYYEAVKGWFKRRHDWEFDTEDIVPSPGTVNALDYAIKEFTKKGDRVIIQRPVYPPFTRVIEVRDRVVANNKMIKTEEGYEIDFDDFETLAADSHTKLFFLCNPQNPTGKIFTVEELNKLGEICAKHDVIMIADEIHGDLIRKDAKFIPMAKVAPKDLKLMTCTAINKTFNCAGLHSTNVIITNPELRERFAKTMFNYMPSPFTIEAVIAGYNEGEEWLDQVKEYIDGNMAYIHNFLKERMPKVKMTVPEGTYVAWMDFSGYGISGQEVHERIYNNANVIMESGWLFGEEHEHYQRMVTVSSRKIIEKALERIEKAFEDLN
jgi:cystathionine beta-lyase